MTTGALIISVYFLLILAGYIAHQYFIRRKEEKEESKYRRCKSCGSRLSEWFKEDNGYMRCYPCGTVSSYRSHRY